ncbi:NgoMIV family type II restriction endonuclease [Streptacidiphilus albus]|uniref:NgoMIV family type II restriction endonuclease n=1 Tax=Streptacidiphilus albus TaxID=105425 RepID=UPI00068F5D2C|nr:NgoMIV family type II restriction endonuclease [Streptacidiphilus albus]
MTAPFSTVLCGYRNGLPNTSDASDKLSIEIGSALFEHLGVPVDQPATPVAKEWAVAMADDLQERLSIPAPHLLIQAERKLLHFEQYAHLDVARSLANDDGLEVAGALAALDALTAADSLLGGEPLVQAVNSVRAAVAGADERRKLLIDLMADESPLNLDLAVERPTIAAVVPGTVLLPHLVAGFSLKWSLRTDRLQDPRTQGSQMAAMRRGRMPHFAAVTMEPRPYYLGRLAMGTGDLDCVYHLALPELSKAVEEVYVGPKRAKQLDTFHRLVDQRRLRDYDELVTYLATL